MKSCFKDKVFIKRRIALKKITAISLAKKPDENESFEFVVHVPSEYDYQFTSPKRAVIIGYISYQIFLLHSDPSQPDWLTDFTFKYFYHNTDKLSNHVATRFQWKKNQLGFLSEQGNGEGMGSQEPQEEQEEQNKEEKQLSNAQKERPSGKVVKEGGQAEEQKEEENEEEITTYKKEFNLKQLVVLLNEDLKAGEIKD